jgi:hypothetical protein
VLACGNADVDLEMLTAASFALLVNHDDGDREYACTQAAEDAVAKAEALGWTVVSMKNDWAAIFAGSPGASHPASRAGGG